MISVRGNISQFRSIYHVVCVEALVCGMYKEDPQIARKQLHSHATQCHTCAVKILCD